ncbi:MAG: hypothetical protein O8C63_04575, partial [Candidatus Methanoperedens sp.]|nr:hypothetical protein [Candidatus Methanoperedens sp.]
MMNTHRKHLLNKSLIGLLVWLTLAIILISVMYLRFDNLNGDTPFGISSSQELSTDPPQYTSFARNKVLFGQWEIFGTRYITFVKNITTIAAYPIFKIIGTGRAQSNAVSVLFVFITFIALFQTWRQKSFNLGLASLAILGFNYIFLSYSKLSFLEVTTIGMVSLGGYFLLRAENRGISSFVAGAIMAAAAFFSKLLAIVFLPASLIVVFVEVMQTDKRKIWKALNPLYTFVMGYAFTLIIWLLFVYLPSVKDVSGYMSEISTGLYGAPRALESVKMFFVWLYSYGFDIRLWTFQPVTFAAGFLGLSLVTGSILSNKKGFFKKIDRVDLFFLMWFLGVFSILFPWNYRPLRYAYLIYPALSYLAARWIIQISDPDNDWGSRVWPFYLMTALTASFIGYHFLIISHFNERSLNIIMQYIPYGLLVGFGIGIVSYILDLAKFTALAKKNRAFNNIFLAISISLLLFITIYQLNMYSSHSPKNQKTIHNASIDLGEILSPDAVIVGPYSSALTQDNHFKSTIKMFGVAVPETDFFNKIPATHIAVESGGGEGSSELRMAKDYPDLVKSAPIVATYYIRNIPVN